VSKTEEPLTKVHLIDLICRLGLSYHFENEIEEILQRIHKNYVENGEIITFQDNLNSLAVLFRLLRQHGLHVSPSICPYLTYEFYYKHKSTTPNQ
jgi:hypothetical protein